MPRIELLDPTKSGRPAEHLENTLRHLVIGQDEAIHQIVRAYQTHVAGLSPVGRPIGNFLFLGPTGSGKTRIVEATAESLEKGKGVTPLLIALAPDGEPKPTPEQVAGFGALFLRDKDQKALAAVLRGMPGLEVTEAELRANRVPVQFVYGGREAKFLKDLIAASKRVLPKAGEVVVEKGDHGSTFLTPEFRRAVLEFLKANRE